MMLSELLDKGGAVMAVILLLSVYVVAVILYKIFQFWYLGAFNTDYIRRIDIALQGNQRSEAIRLAHKSKGPIARVVEAALRCAISVDLSDKKRESQVSAIGSRELRVFESHLRGLEMAANIAPLLGLLGTVIGMVKAFSGIGEFGTRVDPAVLAGGIWEALLTTVVGLIVAIPALAAHYMIDSKIEKIRAVTKDTVVNILNDHTAPAGA